MGIDAGRILTFDVGIEQVLASLPEDARLPEADRPLIPSEIEPDHHLESVLGAKGLDEVAVDALKPELTDRDLLIPERYRAMLDDSVEELKKEAASARSHDGDALFQAATMLEADKGLVELLSTFRNLLIKA